MFPLTEGNRHVAQLMFSSGTCPRCIFRFCGVALPAPYKRPTKELLSDLQKFLEPKKHELVLEAPNPPLKKIRLHEDGIDNLSEYGKEGVCVTEDESMASKLRVCNVCLGILQGFCEKGFVTEVCQKVEASGFEFSSVVLSVSFPPQLSVREGKCDHVIFLKKKKKVEGSFWGEESEGSASGSTK
ncbi:putative tRNA pseudouridine synthase Pus10 [Grammomys surdaster]|uniref:putative tRNA pseudouridine synthase Pus10 n=1 Tax=Grammomys surdaster TaxID=491861 RepID=UPI0010A00514|nr:putative tRNA pseudouridine synthase Pus10 [Grammomys surdaster]XP_028617283.1 putative tRNA pseudouridine synthase Pus10 [Grammomys surdaster]XP_028617284.1 putative tRNA pseudouridine synthase Pus10 [Grammomys surdaster]XP_028617285.1 putative tRNA pseudouridine synthase Pus10 [Grammomys surdaster]XP_028617299.1 putative tRNA pseudouridine synthase Pus10 [Grammomys surdaster]XP_028617300.1 putative tRNA pseudouridine synthase Pus10 [Grammomys surdaster]XP_028617301.1 putative tRNA pseudo